jgi:hypothetical protein
MRLIYDNQLDDLLASQITASTEETLYEATRVLEQRLTVQWQTTAATDQSIIFDAGGSAQAMFATTTSIVIDPENLTSANWRDSSTSRATATSILNKVACSISGSTSSAYAYQTYANTYFATGEKAMLSCIVKKNTGDTPKIVFEELAYGYLIDVRPDFATKTVGYTTSGDQHFEWWIDDETVQIFVESASINNGSHQTRIRFYPTTTTGSAVIDVTAAMVTNTDFPHAYTATTRAAWATTYNYRLPPSGKFIVDCEFRPYFNYDTASKAYLFMWYGDTDNYFEGAYDQSTDKISFVWKCNGTSSILTNSTAFDGGTAQTINQTIRCVISMDVSEDGVTTGSSFYMIPRDQGSMQEDSEWSAAINGISELGNALSTLRIGVHGVNTLRGTMNYFRIYGGTLSSGLADEEAIDDELATKTLTYSQDYRGHFDLETVAILGHNLSPEADIKAEFNDWNEWNYTDGSGSSIIQESLSWDDETIMKFFTSRVKRQYVRFTINDPNNDDGVLKIGRIWAGEYLDVDPSSLDDFTITKKRSDRNIYGINRQKWSDVGVGWRQFNLSFPRTGTTMLEKVQRMYDAVGNHSSIIFCNFDSLRDYEIVEPCYCSLVGEIAFKHRGHQKYEYSLTLEEDK